MAITGSPRDRGVYDDKRLFERYMKWGAAATHEKLRQWCLEHGMFNPSLGRPSHMGAYWAVWRYALENPEEGYPLYREWWYESDPRKRIPTFKHFLINIQTHAYNKNSICGHQKYLQFCERWELSVTPDKGRMEREFEYQELIYEENRQNQEVSVEAGNAVG